MRILMIAPEPFFEARGTPFSEYHRIRALTGLGHTVDLVTYPFGREVEIPGLRIFRSLRPPGVGSVRVGPSWAKVALDMALVLTALRRVVSTRYDVVHSHEEGAAIGLALAACTRSPHLYDMHSSLPQQLENFAFSRSRFLRWVFTRLERSAIRRSRVTIVICPYLAEHVRAIDPRAAVVLIENAPGSGAVPTPGAGLAVRERLGLEPRTPLVLYTGTFEAYQGLDLLLEAMRVVVAGRPEVRLVLAGGKPTQVSAFRRLADARGVGPTVVFAGERPAEEIPDFLDAADVLVSPRSTGTNTPLKIYQYLRSGRPIVATRLLTHTQVLDDSVAELVEATPEAFGRGILSLLGDPVRARALAAAARQLAETRYSDAAYIEKTRESYALIAGDGAPVRSAPGGGR